MRETYLNIWRWTVVLLAVPQGLIVIFLKSLLIWIGQPEDVATETWLFCILAFPGIVLLNLFEWNRRYLVWCELILNLISVCGFLLQLIMLCFCSIFLKWGVIEVGIATSVSCIVSFVVLEIYTWTLNDSLHQSKWRFVPSEMITHLPSFAGYALPCCFTLILFWWPQEILVVYAGWIGVHQLAVMAVFASLQLFIADIFLSIGLAAVALAGNNLGANKPHRAKTFIRLCLIVGTGLAFIIVFAMWIFQEALFSIYTVNQNEVDIMSNIFLLFLSNVFLMCVYEVSIESLEVLGYQNILPFILIFFRWIVMFIGCYVLAFSFGLGLTGIYLVCTASSLVEVTIHQFLIHWSNWEAIALEASKHQEDE